MRIPGIRQAHLLLLRALLLDGEPARLAWRQWIARTDIERLEHGTSRLLPLLDQRIRALGVPGSDIPARMGGLCRKAWTGNVVLLHAVEPALTALHGQGVEFMLIKGAALLLAHYRDLRVRPLTDVDVMVRPGWRARAADILRDCRWMPHRLDRDETLHFRHAHGHRLTLREHALLECADRGIAEAAWETRRVVTLGELEVRVPDPTALLFHVSVYGLYPPLPPPIRWAADAATLLRDPGVEVSWETIVRRAERAGVTWHLHAATEFLRHDLQPDVPRLGLGRPRDRWEYIVTMWGQRRLGQLPRRWFHARRRGESCARLLMRRHGLNRTAALRRALADRPMDSPPRPAGRSDEQA